MTASRLFLLLCMSMLFASGCSMEKLTHQQKRDAYRQALEATEETAYGGWNGEPERLSAALDRLQQYYSDVTIQNVRSMTSEVYAEDAFLCDTLHVANGADEIERYFITTAQRVKNMEVSIFDYSSTGKEIYARWSMTIQSDELAGGQPVTSYGMSHFRLNRQGKVVLHQDFWDASAGFFEHLPGIGGALQRIRGRL